MTALTIQNDIIKLINNDTMSLETLKQLLVPATDCIENPLIAQNIVDIVTILTTDRNGNGQLDVQDLQLIGQDPTVIISLVTLLIMILTQLPTLRITVDANETELVIFKILLYVFFVIIPDKTGLKLNKEDKMMILNLVLLIIQTVKTLGVTQNVINKIISWVKTKKFCSCITVKNDEIIETKIVEEKTELLKSVNNVRSIQATNKKFVELEKKLTIPDTKRKK